MPRVRLIVGYDGTEFFGSQVQAGKRTVQGELERVVQHVAPGSGRLSFAGRTDRGVHAVGQVASGDVMWRESPEALRTAINAVAPADLVVSQVEPVPDGFHARYDALWREYEYRIHVAESPPVLDRRYVWWRRKGIDLVLAQSASARFVGTQHFGSFAGLGLSRSADDAGLTRTVMECEWHAEPIAPCDAASGSSEWRHLVRIRADGFLPQMVRNIVAAIVTVAQGNRPPEWIDELLLTRERSALGEAAPPHGLTLQRVAYAEDA